jgi:hypothetical protein
LDILEGSTWVKGLGFYQAAAAWTMLWQVAGALPASLWSARGRCAASAPGPEISPVRPKRPQKAGFASCQSTPWPSRSSRSCSLMPSSSAGWRRRLQA